MKFYGTEAETIVENSRGELFIVQSVDFPEGKIYEQIDELPEGVQELSAIACSDIEVPEELL